MCVCLNLGKSRATDNTVKNYLAVSVTLSLSMHQVCSINSHRLPPIPVRCSTSRHFTMRKNCPPFPRNISISTHLRLITSCNILEQRRTSNSETRDQLLFCNNISLVMQWLITFRLIASTSILVPVIAVQIIPWFKPQSHGLSDKEGNSNQLLRHAVSWYLSISKTNL